MVALAGLVGLVRLLRGIGAPFLGPTVFRGVSPLITIVAITVKGPIMGLLSVTLLPEMLLTPTAVLHLLRPVVLEVPPAPLLGCCDVHHPFQHSLFPGLLVFVVWSVLSSLSPVFALFSLALLLLGLGVR